MPSTLATATAAAWSAIKSVFTAQVSADGQSLATATAAAWGAGTSAYADVFTVARRRRAYADLARFAEEDPTAGRALSLIADTMAAVPLLPVDASGDVASGDAADALARLLAAPGGDAMPRHAWFSLAVRYLYTGGGFYVDLSAAPTTGPNARRPDRIPIIGPDRLSRVERDVAGVVVRYHFTTAAGRAYVRAVEDVVFVRIPDPADPDVGLPVLRAAARAMERMAMEDDRAIRAARNGGQDIPNVFELTQDADLARALAVPGAMDAAADTLRRQFAEAQASGQALVLGPLVRLAAMPRTATPAQASDDYERALRIVASVCGVPATLLSSEKAGSLTDAGLDSEMKALYVLTVLPMLSGHILGTLSPALIARFGCTAEPDTSDIPALQEDADAKAERFVGLVRERIVSVAEAREEMGFKADTSPVRVEAVDVTPERLRLPAAPGKAHALATDTLAGNAYAWLVQESTTD